MSETGLKTAIDYGSQLKNFKDISEAEKYFFSYKDSLLNEFESICLNKDFFTADYSIDSLKKLEKWYFDLCEKDEFVHIGITRELLEKMMAIYFGEVAVRNDLKVQWIVKEYPFVKGKYEFYISKGFMSMAIIDKFDNLCTRQDNKRKNLMFREYHKNFSR